ncbi:MAG TPA: hypothetical protein VH989_04675, partial [Actinomycetota bacterium]
MSALGLHATGSRAPARRELISLRERARFLEGLRGAFAVLVLGAAIAEPRTGVARLAVGTILYLVVSIAPLVLSRLGRDRVLALLEGTLLIDGA